MNAKNGGDLVFTGVGDREAWIGKFDPEFARIANLLLSIMASIGIKSLKSLSDDEIRTVFKMVVDDPWIVGVNGGVIAGLSVGTGFLVPSDERAATENRGDYDRAIYGRKKRDLVLSDKGLEVVRGVLNNFDDPMELPQNTVTFSDGSPLQFSNGEYIRFSDSAEVVENVNRSALGFEEQGAIIQAQGEKSTNFDSTAWTGIPSGTQRVRAVQALMPTAMASIDTLIAHLEGAARHNGGPPLDDKIDDTLIDLRNLHRALGDILTAADDGALETNSANGLMAEASKYIRRATKALKEDPLPYALSVTIFAVLTACGISDIGGYFSAFALQGTKSKAKGA